MKICYRLSLFVLLALRMPDSAFAQIHDSLILVEFYKNTNGEIWKNDSHWLVNRLYTWH